jgi:pilus assembly protein Flp/PilA
MSKLGNFVVEFLKREDGPTAVEYAVMLALIIVVCIATIKSVGTAANGQFNTVATTLGASGSGS